MKSLYRSLYNFPADAPSNLGFIQKAETTLYKAVLPKLIWKTLGKEAVMEKKPKPQKKHGASFCSLESNLNHLLPKQIPICYRVSKMQNSHKSLILKKEFTQSQLPALAKLPKKQ